MTKITDKSLFPRSWKDNNLEADFITQPYISGLYVAATKNGRNILQVGLDYKNLNSFVKKLQKNKEITDLNLQPLGAYLNETQLSYIIN